MATLLAVEAKATHQGPDLSRSIRLAPYRYSKVAKPFGVYRLSRIFERKRKPRDLLVVSELHDETDINEDTDGKARCMIDAIWA